MREPSWSCLGRDSYSFNNPSIPIYSGFPRPIRKSVLHKKPNLRVHIVNVDHEVHDSAHRIPASNLVSLESCVSVPKRAQAPYRFQRVLESSERLESLSLVSSIRWRKTTGSYISTDGEPRGPMGRLPPIKQLTIAPPDPATFQVTKLKPFHIWDLTQLQFLHLNVGYTGLQFFHQLGPHYPVIFTNLKFLKLEEALDQLVSYRHRRYFIPRIVKALYDITALEGLHLKCDIMGMDLGCITKHGSTLQDLDLAQPQPFAGHELHTFTERRIIPPMLTTENLKCIREACPHLTNLGVDLHPQYMVRSPCIAIYHR